LDKALKQGIENWLDRDWKKKVGKVSKNSISGLTACPGFVEGKVFLVTEKRNLALFPGDLILVAPILKPDAFSIIKAKRPLAIVTDHGGQNSHSATFARELGITCVVGTGEATKFLNHGSKIRIHARKNGEADIFHHIA